MPAPSSPPPSPSSPPPLASSSSANDAAQASDRHLFDFLLANTPDQVYFKDRNGRFLRISRAVAEYLGARDSAEVVGRTDFDFWDPETARAAAADERRIMETGEPLVGKIERLVYPNGRVAWDYTTKLPLRDANGEIIGICGINKDFTRMKEMEDALEAERDRLRITTAELQARNAQIQADLEMARHIQHALLPRDCGALALSHTGAFVRNALSFAYCYLPAAAVGGDFFHVFRLPGERAGIFICDVMGHGVRAALITAIIRALMEELRPLMPTPGPFLSALNRRVRTILARVDEPFVATALFAVADPAAGEWQVANAAHPIPVRLRPGAGVIGPLQEEGQRPGPALGLIDEVTYATGRCAFERSDRVVFFTDGAFEVDSPTGEEFGREALLSDFGKHAALPAPELFTAVLEEVRRFSARPDFADDVCLVACEQSTAAVAETHAAGEASASPLPSP